MHSIHIVLALAASLGLAACGGGSGSGEPVPAASGSAGTVALVAGQISFEGQTLTRGTVASTGLTASLTVSDIAAVADMALVHGEFPNSQPNDPRLFQVKTDGTVTPVRGSWDARAPCGLLFGCYFKDSLALTSTPTGKALLFQASDSTLSQFGAAGLERQFTVPQLGLSNEGVPWQRGMAADLSGNLYFFAPDSTIRKLAPDGAVTMLAAGLLARGGSYGLAADGEGNVFVTEQRSGIVRKIAVAGAVSTLEGFAASSVTADQAGNLYGLNGRAVMKRAVDGTVTALLGPTPAGAELRPTMADLVAAPQRVALGPDGLWLTGSTATRSPQLGFVALSNVARRAAPSGTDPLTGGPAASGSIATIAGQSQLGADPGRGVETGTGQPARFKYSINDFAVLSDGSVIAAATLASDPGSRLVKIRTDGTVTALQGEWRARLCSPFESAPVYLGCDLLGERLTVTGTPDGKALVIYARYSANDVAEIWGPEGVENRFAWFGALDHTPVAMDAAGTIYFVGGRKHTAESLSKRGADGVASFIAGSVDGARRGSFDGTGAAAGFTSISGIAVDAQGTVFIADNYSIRKVTPAGSVTTLAGQPGVPGAADGLGSAARFSNLGRLALDPAGNIYVADPINGAVRKVTSDGRVTTVAGRLSGAPAGPGPTGQVLFHPMSVAVSSQGLWIGELNRLARVPLSAP